MTNEAQTMPHDFSDVCTGLCKGLCCKPWWGIIAYSTGQDGGANARQFRAGLIKGMKERCTRIMDAYVTNERPPRRLFNPPQLYNLILKSVRPAHTGFTLDLIAMFAFECLYLAGNNTCSIHPTANDGRDIRPPHCAALGAPGALEGGKGFCRIIHAAETSMNAPAEEREKLIKKAWQTETETSQRHYAASKPSVEEAVDCVMERITEYMPQTTQVKEGADAMAKAGRNDPCPCGSGKKFKKCHGG